MRNDLPLAAHVEEQARAHHVGGLRVVDAGDARRALQRLHVDGPRRRQEVLPARHLDVRPPLREVEALRGHRGVPLRVAPPLADLAAVLLHERGGAQQARTRLGPRGLVGRLVQRVQVAHEGEQPAVGLDPREYRAGAVLEAVERPVSDVAVRGGHEAPRVVPLAEAAREDLHGGPVLVGVHLVEPHAAGLHAVLGVRVAGPVLEATPGLQVMQLNFVPVEALAEVVRALLEHPPEVVVAYARLRLGRGAHVHVVVLDAVCRADHAKGQEGPEARLAVTPPHVEEEVRPAREVALAEGAEPQRHEEPLVVRQLEGEVPLVAHVAPEALPVHPQALGREGLAHVGAQRPHVRARGHAPALHVAQPPRYLGDGYPLVRRVPGGPHITAPASRRPARRRRRPCAPCRATPPGRTPCASGRTCPLPSSSRRTRPRRAPC